MSVCVCVFMVVEREGGSDRQKSRCYYPYPPPHPPCKHITTISVSSISLVITLMIKSYERNLISTSLNLDSHTAFHITYTDLPMVNIGRRQFHVHGRKNVFPKCNGHQYVVGELQSIRVPAVAVKQVFCLFIVLLLEAGMAIVCD